MDKSIPTQPENEVQLLTYPELVSVVAQHRLIVQGLALAVASLQGQLKQTQDRVEELVEILEDLYYEDDDDDVQNVIDVTAITPVVVED